jgi:hypothetical protein
MPSAKLLWKVNVQASYNTIAKIQNRCFTLL